MSAESVKAGLTGNGRREWRVTWRRDDWAPDTQGSRLFQSEPAARRFVAKLTGFEPYDRDGRELAPVTITGIRSRPVGQWVDHAVPS